MGLPCPDGDVGASRRIGELKYLYQEREICMYEWIEKIKFGNLHFGLRSVSCC